MTITFMDNAFDHFNEWIDTDKSVLKKIKSLLKDIERTPYDGLGKPEALKHNLSGYWSRRITDEHRLVYKVENDTIIIVSCKYHYEFSILSPMLIPLKNIFIQKKVELSFFGTPPASKL